MKFIQVLGVNIKKIIKILKSNRLNRIFWKQIEKLRTLFERSFNKLPKFVPFTPEPPPLPIRKNTMDFCLTVFSDLIPYAVRYAFVLLIFTKCLQ